MIDPSDDRRPAFEEPELFLEIAQRSAGMGFVSLDPLTMRLSLSNWVRTLIGAETPTIAVDEVPDFLPTPEQGRVMAEIAAIVAGKAPFEFETILRTKDAATLIVRIAGDAVYADETGALIGFYAVIQDIDAMRRSEASAREAAERAVQDLRSREAVVATLSHEIRTPLTGIIGIIDHLRREPRTEERSRALALIEESARALLATLDTVLRQTQSENDSTHGSVEPFLPADVARRVADLFRPLARRKGLALEFTYNGADRAPGAFGPSSQLQQILSNAVSNAIKFTSTGRVTLSCRAPDTADGIWQFEITDTGSGIAQERLDRIFAPFAGSAPDTLGRKSGTGLGLSIVRRMVDALGGSIAVKSEVGAGTRIAISLAFQQVADLPTQQQHSGRLVYHCAAASRAIPVAAIAERLGYDAEPFDNTNWPGPHILVCDEELWTAMSGFIPDDGTLIILGENSMPNHRAGAANVHTIAATRLAHDLPELLLRIANG